MDNNNTPIRENHLLKMVKTFFATDWAIRNKTAVYLITLFVTVWGVMLFVTLPKERFPDVVIPNIYVQTVYVGNSPKDMENLVTRPIEKQLKGITGVKVNKITSTSLQDFSAVIVEFGTDVKTDVALQKVRDAVDKSKRDLPTDLTQEPVVAEISLSEFPIMAVNVSGDYDGIKLKEYADKLKDRIEEMTEISRVDLVGAPEREIQINVDRYKMEVAKVGFSDIEQAIQRENADITVGQLTVGDQKRTMRVNGQFITAFDLNQVIVKNISGAPLYLRDLATIVDTVKERESYSRLNGKNVVSLSVIKRAGENLIEASKKIHAIVADMQKQDFPKDLKVDITGDQSIMAATSFNELVNSIIIGFILVVIVLMFFMGVTNAFFVALSVPLSMFLAFIFLPSAEFITGSSVSLNFIVLFALLFGLGIVVDDAIVVIENVERIMEEYGVSPRVAADRAMRQVGGALVAIVLVLCAVFIPVAFLGGITGEMYKQFAVTIVLAVVLSGLVALTLTPALCALLLKPKDAHPQEARGVFGAFNHFFRRLTERYVGTVGGLLGRPRAVLAAFAVLLALTGVLFRRVPRAFIPSEDKGFFAVALQLPDGASRQRTEAAVAQIEGFLKDDPGVRHVASLVGLDALTFAAQTNSAILFVNLKPWEERKTRETSIDAVIGRLNGKLFGMKEALAFAFNFPEIPGLGTTSGLELNLQQRSGTDLQQFARTVQAFIADAQQQGAVLGAQTTFRADVPQVYVHVDRETAKARGVGLADLFSTLQAMLSTLYINDFNLYGRTYRVQAEAQSRFRQTPEDIGRLYVRSSRGEMVPVSALTRTEFRGGPAILTRFNGFNAALITGVPAPGKSSGDMLDAVERLVKEKYEAEGIGAAYSGQSFQERASSGQGGLVFALGLILVFLVLAAQYESWAIPFAVLFGIPFGIFGAFLGVWLRGMPSDVYFQVGLITVVGLAAKNAILIVEFATELRGRGLSLREAAMEAARERFRPILMTSFAFILGVLPLMIAGGAGAASRQSLGTAVFAGMLGATLVGVFFIPNFFALIRGASERLQAAPQAAAAPVPAGAGLTPEDRR